MKPHTTHFDDCGCVSNRYQKEISALKSLIGKERDEFGKRETSLMAEIKIIKAANNSWQKDWRKVIDALVKERDRYKAAMQQTVAMLVLELKK